MAEVNQQQVIDYIKGISVIELSQLVKALESELVPNNAGSLVASLNGCGTKIQSGSTWLGSTMPGNTLRKSLFYSLSNFSINGFPPSQVISILRSLVGLSMVTLSPEVSVELYFFGACHICLEGPRVSNAITATG